MTNYDDLDPTTLLEPATIINGRLAFLGQEPVRLESFLDAADLLELELTTNDLFNAAAISDRLVRLPKVLPTEYHVAARSIAHLWVSQTIRDSKEN